MSSKNTGKCPVIHGSNTRQHGDGNKNSDWWPNQLNLKLLRQHDRKSNPLDQNFNYREAFLKLDLKKVKGDIKEVLLDSKSWWPADYGNYGPFMIRLAWHAAGTYRTADGRGGGNLGDQRFAPINSWPDNVNLDKARRLLWPIKKKYGQNLSWADLFILVGNVAIETMGLNTAGFGGGREDVFEPEDGVYWGSEKEWLANQRYTGDRELERPLAAVQMGLIYVNPEGPDGNPDPLASARDIRETFTRMGVNDYETVALTAGGHTFGKCHGAGDPSFVGPAPEGAPIEQMGLGWKSTFKSGHGRDTIGSGLEGSWTPTPTKWDNSYFEVLFKYEWVLTTSPAGANQWTPKSIEGKDKAPQVDNSDETVTLMMTTADMAMKEDPIYKKISEHFFKNPDEFAKAFADAWFKLTHRDMGPKSRYLGSEVPDHDFIWQDPLPRKNSNDQMLTHKDINDLKKSILQTKLTNYELIYTAWSSASTFRKSDYRGGANGARIQLSPQKNWVINHPNQLDDILAKFIKIKDDFYKKVSLADLIILGGSVGLERASSNTVSVDFNSGRVDAIQNQTDVESFAVLEPLADGFRNYIKAEYTSTPEEMLIDKADLLNLSIPEMTVLIGGLRVLGINFDENDQRGVLTNSPGKLSNDFFVEITDMNTKWIPKIDKNKAYYDYEGYDIKTGNLKWTASRVDLIFGCNSELRAISEVYGADDAKEKFKKDFVNAWNKVMNADRFDL